MNSIGYTDGPEAVINMGLNFTTNFYAVTTEKLQVDEHSIGFGGFFCCLRGGFFCLSVVVWFGALL